MLERVTGRLKGEGAAEETPGRRKRRRMDEPQPSPAAGAETFAVGMEVPELQTGEQFGEGQGWSQTGQTQDFGMVGQNVDPGLEMPHGS